MRPLALTLGDPSGIGPEIALGAWAARRWDGDIPPFYVVGDLDLIAARARRDHMNAAIESCDPAEAARIFASALPVVATRNKAEDRPGMAMPANAAVTVEAIETAVLHVRDGMAAAVVTAPISKKPLYEAGFKYPGHTEFLGHLAERDFGVSSTPVMMLAGPGIRAVPVTIHIALSRVPSSLTTEAIVSVCRIVSRELATRFAIATPRLAVSGLNPHAGEGGSMGTEETTIIAPAIEGLKGEGIAAAGPLPADTMFHAAARATYDAAICMYHDQALVPVKTLAFDDAVNVTLGLPFIRTSPDHGTAFDIAGKGLARADSLIAALKLARGLARNEAARKDG